MLIINKTKETALDVDQYEGYCGPCSVAACYFLLYNKSLSQSFVGNLVRSRKYIYRNGLDEQDLKKVSELLHMKTTELYIPKRKKGKEFLNRIYKRFPNPSILLIEDFSHWVVVIGKLKDCILVYDSIRIPHIRQWSEKTLYKKVWNTGSDDVCSQYYALLLRRVDKKEPVVKIAETSR